MNKSKMMHRSAAAVLAALMMAAAGTTALAAETPGLSLGQDGAVAAGISLLQPDSTYYFPVQYTHPDGRTVVLPASEAEALELEVKEGTALESAAVRTWNGRCYVRVETAGEIRDGDTHGAELTLRYSRREGAELDVAVTAGLRQANLSSVQAGEPVAVRPYMPLYTVPQQMELARLNRWHPVTFTGEGWSFTGTLTARDTVDFSATQESIPAVKRFLQGAPAVYLGFPGGGNFQNGRLTIDLSQFRTQLDGPVYAYRYLYGRLYRVPAIHDVEANTITLSVTNLGRYVLTGEKFPEATPVD